MENPKIIIRPIRKEDLQDLWENVYSSMTPKEINDLKIMPSIERLHKKEGIELVAEVDGKVIMSLPMVKPFWIPFGILFDNNYILTNGIEDEIMKMFLNEIKNQCKLMKISTLISPQKAGCKNVEAFIYHGFEKMWETKDWVYLAINI